jgi:MFS family permease
MIAALLRPIRSAADTFRPASMPLMSRGNYRWEMISAFFFPFALMCVEPGLAGVIAQKAFGAPPWIIAAISAAPFMALITSALWTRLLHGRDRVGFVRLMLIGMVVCVVIAAAAPTTAIGLAILLLAIIGGRIFWSGVLTGRAEVWRNNYPRRFRARAAGNYTIVAALIVSLGGFLLADTLDRVGPDRAETAYRFAYLAAAGLALIGVWAYGRVRWRARRATLREEARPVERAGDAHPASLTAMLRALRTDAIWRRYMIAMFLLGMGNLAANAPFIIAIDRELGLEYRESITLTLVFPYLVPAFVISFWAWWLDRVHIARYRAVHAWVFVAAQALTGVALVMGSLPLLFAARIVLGVAMGGGMIAWNLGHHDLAPRELAGVYMGMHATLTGVRGLLAPFLGTWLYQGFGDTPGLGPAAFFLFAGSCAAGGVMFLLLDRQVRRRRDRESAEVDPT